MSAEDELWKHGRTRRPYFVGRTKVYTDPSGNPCAFERDGHLVGCVCDDVTGTQCVFHAELEERAARAAK